MPRKSLETLEQKRNEIKSRYRRGRKTSGRRVTNLGTLSEVEIATKKEAACFFKAADFSYTYIAEALNTTRKIVKDWFLEAGMVARVNEIQGDFLDGAIKLLRTYAVELIEMLVEIARTTHDEKVAIQAITEALDRMGITKVNKSESAAVVTRKDELDITDKTGIVARAKNAPPEVQQQMARQMEDLLALAEEHAEPAERVAP